MCSIRSWSLILLKFGIFILIVLNPSFRPQKYRWYFFVREQSKLFQVGEYLGLILSSLFLVSGSSHRRVLRASWLQRDSWFLHLSAKYEIWKMMISVAKNFKGMSMAPQTYLEASISITSYLGLDPPWWRVGCMVHSPLTPPTDPPPCDLLRMEQERRITRMMDMRNVPAIAPRTYGTKKMSPMKEDRIWSTSPIKSSTVLVSLVSVSIWISISGRTPLIGFAISLPKSDESLCIVSIWRFRCWAPWSMVEIWSVKLPVKRVKLKMSSYTYAYK